MKKTSKIISIILCLSLLLSLCIPSFAADGEATEPYVSKVDVSKLGEGAKYPFILVHGMMGWGDNAEGKHDSKYWGFSEGMDIVEHLRSIGCKAYAPTVGPMSSAWDRACELYAQLTGTVVDYGAAHSAACGHARYGRDYTGRSIMEQPWDVESKINLISHSFGGATVNVFTSLMEYGSAEEIAAAPDDCSELFKGGHEGLVYSVSTLASPHNGTPVANLLYDTFVPVLLVSFVINIFGMSKNPMIDFMFDQWGVTVDPSTGERAKLNPLACWKAVKSGDHCAKDMTIKGARELNERTKTAAHTYYFSYAADMTVINENGKRVIPDSMSKNPLSMSGKIALACAGKFIGGEYLDESWGPNDGLVPVVSALYPFTEEDNHIVYSDSTEVQPGVWYSMPVWENGSHGSHVSGTPEALFGFYDALVERVGSIG